MGPRQGPTRLACLPCRKKRAKCNGQEPCDRCDQSRQTCTFDRSPNTTKNEIRDEIEHLKKLTGQDGALLDAMSANEGSAAYNLVSRSLGDPSMTRKTVFKNLEALGQSLRPSSVHQDSEQDISRAVFPSAMGIAHDFGFSSAAELEAITSPVYMAPWSMNWPFEGTMPDLGQGPASDWAMQAGATAALPSLVPDPGTELSISTEAPEQPLLLNSNYLYDQQARNWAKP